MNQTSVISGKHQYILGSHIQQRVVFVGPFGVGKTTALRTISDTPVVSTEALSHEMIVADMLGKTTTTVGLDYGEWHLPSGQPVGLMGVPGQVRFEAVWDTLITDTSAIVLWLFGNQRDSLEQATLWLDLLAKRDAVKNLAVAVTRLPEPIADRSLDPYRRLVQPYHPWMPVLSADPRRASDVVQSVAMALYHTATGQSSLGTALPQ